MSDVNIHLHLITSGKYAAVVLAAVEWYESQGKKKQKHRVAEEKLSKAIDKMFEVA